MVESDHNEGDNTVQQKIWNNTMLNKVSNKRPRDELSDVGIEIYNKKVCSKDLVNVENKVNLNSFYTTDEKDINNPNNNIKNSENESKDSKNLSEYYKMKINSNNKKNEIGQEDNNLNKNNIHDTEENKINYKKEDKNQMNIEHTENLEKNVNKKKDQMVVKAIEKNLTNHKEFDVKHINKIQNNEIEIINGVELIVECISDQEFCEESEKEEIKKPRSKTVIIREIPNDSEVDASSSEAEKSDSYKIVEAKSKINANLKAYTSGKQKKKRDKKKSLSEIIVSGSENSTESNFDDEDYSPVAKKKVKKLNPKKSNIKSTKIKKGTGRPRGRPPKIKKIEKKLSDDKKEQIAEIVEEKIVEKGNNNLDARTKESKNLNSTDKLTSQSSESKLVDSDSNNSNDDNDNMKNKNKKKSSQRNIKKIDKLKRFIRSAGIKVHCYQTLLKDCKTDAAKAKCLNEFLEEQGMVGRPTLEKCKKLRIKNDTFKEIQELGTKSIISETRSTRCRNIRKCRVQLEVPASPIQKSHFSLRKIKSILDSDSE